MKTRSILSWFVYLRWTALLICVATASSARAATLWNGPSMNFTQSDAQPADVLVSGAVALSRNGNQWLYNTNVDIDPFTGLPGPTAGSPSDTEWAFGTLDTYATNKYQSFDSFRDGDLSSVLVTVPPSPMVVHLINEGIYLQVTFTQWPHGGGFFAYNRTTPAAVAPPPSVTITNPANNTVFAAPANVTIAADATVSGGIVTNVAFFGNSSPLGSRQGAPFSITANNLSAGPYALTAVATAAGISTTSSVVNISVVSPVTTSLSAPAAVANQFSFSYSVNPGLRYVIESSSNLFDWTPLVTNVPTSDPAFFSNVISGDGSYYRVGRLPNP